MMLSLSLMSKYWRQIQQGIKTVEGRLFVGTASKIKPLDVICFNIDNQASKVLFCRVIKVQRFESFEKMLQSMGLKNCLPDIDSIEEGVRIYRSFPQYAEKENDYGAVGFLIEHLPYFRL